MSTIDKILQLVEESGLTAKEYAINAGLGAGNITDWKTGRSKPSVESLQKISRYANVQLEWLTGDSKYRTKEEEVFNFYTTTFSVPPEIMNTALGNNIDPNLTLDEIFILKKILEAKNACFDRDETFDVNAFCKKNEDLLDKYNVSSIRKAIDEYGKLLFAEKEVWRTALENTKKSPVNGTLKVPNSALEFAGYKKNKYYMCPVYGRISAGQPNWAEECIEGRIPIDPELMNILNPEECFFLRVNGESMNKEISNGSFALIRKQDMVENGEIAVVLVNGDEATLKKFSKQADVVVLEPMSNDPSYSIQIYNKDTEIKVIGKYIGKMEMK